jgi:hypothetical protein
MPRSTPPVDLIRRAAELRAAGSTWETISAKVSRAAQTVRRWPLHYPREWAQAFSRAFCVGLSDAGVESFFTLRKHGRSEDARLSQDTSKFFMKMTMDALRQLLNAEQNADRKSKWSAYIAFLEKLGDEDAKRLVDGFVAQRMAERSAADDGRVDAGGPALGA